MFTQDTQPTTKQFEKLHCELLNRLIDLSNTKHLNKREIQDRREARLKSNCNHKYGVYFAKSCRTRQMRAIPVACGQFFTTYTKLCDLWCCTKEQARYQLRKWQQEEKITVETIKDKYGFNLGMKITHKWLYNQTKEQAEKRKAKREQKIHTLAKNKKSQENSKKLKEQKKFNFHFHTPNRELLKNNNIHENDEILERKEKTKENQNQENQPTDPQVEATIAKLSDIGMNPIIIKRLLSLYTLQKIQIYLDLLKLQKNIKKPAGWLFQALKQDYDLGEVEKLRAREEEEKREAEERQRRREEEARQEAEKIERKRKQDEQVRAWIEANGEEAENQLYFDVLAEYKKTNRFIYEFLTKRQAKDVDLLEILKGSFLVKARVSGLILEQSEHEGGGCNSCERLKHEQSTVGLSLPLSPFG